MRWRRNLFYAHDSHVEERSYEHRNELPTRSPVPAYGVGLVHGIGGSGGLTLLLLSTISDKVEAIGALLLFAAGTAVSMALLSTAFGLALAGGSGGPKLRAGRARTRGLEPGFRGLVRARGAGSRDISILVPAVRRPRLPLLT